MIERTIDFERPRQLRCGACANEWAASADWLDRFDDALEGCPTCGTDCQGEDRPDFIANPNDPAHDDATTRDLYWYHSSTHETWPDRDFDPAASLTDAMKQRMRTGNRDVERWAARQKSKALHIGTYEAAIENMLRRMARQGSSEKQFFLYRVRLQQSCVIAPGVHPEPTNFVGDAYLAEICEPDVNVLRYANVHEDASSISLAITIDAVEAVQRISIPLPVSSTDPWLMHATTRLNDATAKPAKPSTLRLRRSRSMTVPPHVIEARRLAAEIGAGLPANLRKRFKVDLDEKAFARSPGAFPAKLAGLVQLVDDPRTVIATLDAQPWRAV